MKNVKVLIGNYGSGKSELALNFAIRAAARGDRTELLDLDMVNTYFRLTERGKLVEQKEIPQLCLLRHRDSVPAGGGVVRLRAGLGQRHL